MIVKTEEGTLPQMMNARYVLAFMDSGHVFEKVYYPNDPDGMTRKMDENNGSTAGWFRNMIVEGMRAR